MPENTPAIVTAGTMLDPVIVTDIFSKVRGHSSIGKLCPEAAIEFNGTDFFTFSMTDEAAVVGEGDAKARGSAALAKVTIRPLLIEYGARFSDKMYYGSEEAQLNVLQQFAEGAARKFARAIDIIGFHGLDPRTGNTISSMSALCFDATNNVISYDSQDPEGNLEDAIAALGEYDVSGFALSKNFAATLAKLKVNGVKQYPEFALGANPGNLNGTACDVNSTVSFDNATKAYVGDMEAVKWGYAKNLPLEVIRFGDPDNTGRDLRGHNEVYLRTEAYVAAVILDKDAIARIATGTSL